MKCYAINGCTVTETEGRHEVRYEIAGGSKRDVAKAVTQITANYHPRGYGTFFHPPMRIGQGEWRTTGMRYASSD